MYSPWAWRNKTQENKTRENKSAANLVRTTGRSGQEGIDTTSKTDVEGSRGGGGSYH